MDICSTSKTFLDMPYMIVSENMVEEINSLFLDLSGYKEKNILGRKVEEVLQQLLRINVDSEDIKYSKESDCYIFDINLNAKEITIRYSEALISGKSVYTFQQKKNIMFEEKFPFLELINSGNTTGVALFSVPGFVLLKANEVYINGFNKRYKTQEDIVGKALEVAVPGWKDSETYHACLDVLKSEQAVTFNERLVESPETGRAYARFTITPIFEEGRVKYLVKLYNDITERVIYKQALSEKNRIIEEQKRQLEIILDTVSKNISLCIVDAEGNFVGESCMRQNYFMPFGYKKNIMETYSPGIYFDEEGNELLLEELPISKALKGETVTDYRIVMKLQNKKRYYSVNSTPIIDSNGKVSMVVICGWEVTESVKSQHLIESQRDYLHMLFNALQLPMLSLSLPDFIIKEMNKQAVMDLRELFGLDPSINESNIIGMHFNEVIPVLKNYNETDFLKRLILSKSAVVHEGMEGVIDGKKVYFKVIYQPIFNVNGEVIELLVIAIDNTVEVEKRNQMEDIMRMKDEFLCLMSHEFKTPLTVINAAVQTMEYIYKDQLPEKAYRLLDKIKQNVYRQLRLVDNLLDTTSINAGQIKLRKSNVDIVFLTKAITESVAIYAKQKDVDMVFTSKLSEKIIGVDDEKFERIMLNLLSNAIKFTPKNKKVVVELSAKLYNKTKMICIKVKDQGFGIPKEKQDQLFKRFGQVDNVLTRQAEGSGVGLYLVKLLVDAFGGSISLESEDGKGSVFTVMIPSKKVIEAGKAVEGQDVFNKRIIHSMATELSDIYF